MSADFFGHRIRERVGVVILAAEGAGTLSHRIEVAKRAADLAERLPVAFISAVPNLADDAEITRLIEKIKLIALHFWVKFNVRLGVIIVDTVAAAFTMADENSNAEASQTLRRVRELGRATGALIILVHHYGKSEGGGLRGASAFQAGADVVISVTADRDGNSRDVKNRSLALEKSRTGSERRISGFDVIHMPLGDDEDGEPFGAGYVEPNDEPATPNKERKEAFSEIALKVAFEIAYEGLGVDQRVNVGLEAPRAAPYEVVQREFLQRYTLPGNGRSRSMPAAKRAYRRCVANLPIEFSDLTDTDGNRWICRRS